VGCLSPASAQPQTTVSVAIVHPVERLRYVTRSGWLPAAVLVEETAAALLSMADDPQGLVTACRRVVDHQPASGPAWWLCSRVLGSANPASEAWQCMDDINADETYGVVEDALADDSTIVVLGTGETMTPGLVRRGDLVIHTADNEMARMIHRAGGDVDHVDLSTLCVLAAEADAVLIEPAALSADSMLCPLGTLGPAAVAGLYQRPVWAVVSVGRWLPTATFGALTSRLGDEIGPDGSWELVPSSLVTYVVTSDATVTTMDALARHSAIAVTPELFVQTAI
jgi:hypothetical protein